MATATRRKTTPYTRLLKAKSSACKGRGTAASVTKAAAAYVKSAMKKGKSKAEANRIANRVIKGTCGARINGKKKSYKKK